MQQQRFSPKAERLGFGFLRFCCCNRRDFEKSGEELLVFMSPGLLQTRQPETMTTSENLSAELA